MLDMHKLKLKYRELSSQYAETLMQPVFKTSKRSYTYLPPTMDSPQLIKHHSGPSSNLEGIINSADEFTTGNNASPENEYLGETASRLKVEIMDGEKQRQSSLTNQNNETFHSLGKMEHKFMPQYQKKTPLSRANNDLFDKNSGLLHPSASGGMVDPSSGAVSQANLNHHMESFGNLRTLATRNPNGLTT